MATKHLIQQYNDIVSSFFLIHETTAENNGAEVDLW